MEGITFEYMDEYLRGLIPESEVFLKELEVFAEEHGVPIAQKETINFLQTMIAIKKPKKILELGTAIGYSAILMNRVCDSSVVTIERDKKMVEIAEENIKKANLEGKIKIIEADCTEALEQLEDEFDFIFMDAGKGHYNKFFPHCMRLLGKDGIIIADNVLFRGMVPNNELLIRRKITIVKRMRKFLKDISEDENLYTSILPMGDGIAIITRRQTK
jgi:predicted O-methyltransferase YrrM